MINAPHFVECWVPYLPDRRFGVFPQYPGILMMEWATLPVSDQESDPLCYRVLSWICLSVDLNGGLISEYMESWFQIPQQEELILLSQIFAKNWLKIFIAKG